MIKLILNKKGSLTLEATIVFPFLLALILLLVNFINVCMIYLAMDHAVSQTTKQIAAHVYPLYFIDKVKTTGLDDFASKMLTDPEAWTNIPDQLASAIISDVYTMVGNHVKEQGCEKLEGVVKLIAQKKLEDYYPLNLPPPDNLEIVKATMYDPLDSDGTNGELHGLTLTNEDVALVIEYKIKLPVPFLLKELKLSNTAVERAWVDNK